MNAVQERPARTLRRRVVAAMTVVIALTGAVWVGAVVIDSQQSPQARVSSSDAHAAASPRPSGATIRALAEVPPVMRASVPVLLTIRAIGVRSSLLHLAQTVQGELQVPAPGPDYDKAGWYQYSPTPGSRGPAVIVGHVDSARSGPSVFFRLGSLHRRDKVVVNRADGSVATFAVDEIRRFPKAHFPSALVYGNTDHAALRLITCGGAFDHASGHYLDNIVVFASLVDT